MTDSSGGGMSAAGRLRLRRTVRQWFVPIVVFLVVVAALGAGTAYATHAEPGETTEERVVSTWSDQADFSHSTTVQRDTAAFPVGTELQNRPAYYTRISPDVTLGYISGYTASDGGSLDVETVLEVRWQGADGDGNVLWQVTEPVASSSWTDVGPDETRGVETTVNVTDINNRIETYQSELGSSRGSVETVFVARTTRSGEINGQSVQHTRVHSIPFDYRESTYGFREPSIETVSREQTETETVPVVYGPVRSAGSILLTVMPLLGAISMGLVRRKGVLELSAAEEAALEHALAREEFDEWITTGTLPASFLDRDPVEVSSLEGVVNVAIDSGRRVIEDGDRYFISTPELSYLYVNETPDIETLPETEPVIGPEMPDDVDVLGEDEVPDEDGMPVEAGDPDRNGRGVPPVAGADWDAAQGADSAASDSAEGDDGDDENENENEN